MHDPGLPHAISEKAEDSSDDAGAVMVSKNNF